MCLCYTYIHAHKLFKKLQNYICIFYTRIQIYKFIRISRQPRDIDAAAVFSKSMYIRITSRRSFQPWRGGANFQRKNIVI